MTLSTFIALMPALLGLALSSAEPGEMRVRSLVVQDQLIMRIPVRPAPPPPVEWVEKKGPKCVSADEIRGAALSRDGDVDFLLRGRTRLRAELSEDCPGLDFWNGFYLSPEDERVCAGRDMIRSRMGGSCRIERFRRLVPRERDDS